MQYSKLNNRCDRVSSRPFSFDWQLDIGAESMPLVSVSNALVMIPLGSVCARRYFRYLRNQNMQGQRRF